MACPGGASPQARGSRLGQLAWAGSLADLAHLPLFEDLELPVRQAACDGFLQMRGVSCQLPASHGKSVGAFGGLDRIRGRQEDIFTSPFALARATGDAGIGAASHHPVSAGAEGRTGAARLPTATFHYRLALVLVASFFVLTIPLAPNAGAEVL